MLGALRNPSGYLAIKSKNFFGDLQSSDLQGQVVPSLTDGIFYSVWLSFRPKETGTLVAAVHRLLTVRLCRNMACHEILLRSVQVVTKM